MTNKEQYRQLCETEGARIPLFLQYWWMESVCRGKRWDVALARSADGRVVGALPYLIGSRWGMRFVVQPQLTPFNGPWYNYVVDPSSGESMGTMTRFEQEQKVAQELIRQLEELHLSCYQQCLSPQIANWQPFYDGGFSQTTRYTYRIDDIGDLQRVFDGFSSKRRQQIRKWQPRYGMELCDDASWFAGFHHDYWRRRGERDVLSREFMEHVVAEALRRDAGAVFRLRDEAGRWAAAAFVVYDVERAWFLQVAHDEGQEQQMPVVILVWEMLRWLSGRTRSFDFAGSMIAGVARFNRTFGAVQTPYFQLTKYSNALVRWLVERRR